MSNTTKKIFKIGGMMAIVVIFFVIIVSVMTYVFHDDSILTQSMRQIVPMPAATVNRTHWISSAAVDDNLRALRHQYNSPQISESGLRVDFSTTEGQKRLLIRKKDILNKMVEDEAILILAKKRDITINADDALDELQQMFAAANEETDVSEQISESYNWNTDTFIERMVIPSMYRQSLEEWFYENNTPDPSLHEKMTQAQKELDDQRQFEDVVKNYSEGQSAELEGEMGWFAAHQLMEELSIKAFTMKEDEVSAIIETPIGYHIIRVNDIKEADENTPELVSLSQIFVAKKTFGQWLEEEMRTMKFNVLSTEFAWDNEYQVVDFSEQEMRNFEEEARNNPQGDASLF